MTVVFAGQARITPSVNSQVNDSAMLNPGLAVGSVLALLGVCTGGKPGVPLTFSNPTDAANTLISGELVDAITRAFDPSSQTGGPAKIVAMRVNPATQSTLAIKDGSAATVGTITSTDYGQRTTQTKVKIEPGSVKGLKATTQNGNAYFVGDNLYRDAFAIQYGGGAASAQMTVDNNTVTLAAPTGTTVATIALASYPTIQQLVDRINATAGFAATVKDGNGAKPALAALDSVTNQDVKTASYTATANLQAFADWINSAAEPLCTFTRAAGAGTVPAAIPWTYLAGGVEGTVSNTEWSNAFSALQTVDVQWVVPVTSSPSVQAMADAHVSYMSTTGRKERRSICGAPLGTDDLSAIALAKTFNSDRTSITHLGGYDYDATGALVLYPPYIVAAMLGGMASAVGAGEPLTGKTLKLRGMERKLRNPADTDALILGGVLAIEDTGAGCEVVKSISTWLNDSKFNRVEISTGAALDATVRAVRDALKPLKGARGSPIALGRAVSITETTLKACAKPDPIGPGWIVGDAKSPPYKNITASLVGDEIAVTFQCSPVIPANFIDVTVFAVPYSGTISL